MILMQLNNFHWSSREYDEHFMTKDDNDEFVWKDNDPDAVKQLPLKFKWIRWAFYDKRW